MNKKGMTWSTIIYAIIAVIVLVTIVWIFRSQLGEVIEGFTGIFKTTTDGTKEVGEGLKNLIENN